MPIANCLVQGDLSGPELDETPAVWAEESGVAAEHMTVNFVPGVRQAGASYAVMAVLHLPSLWSDEEVRRLEIGLARALGRTLAVELADVHVITQIVESGYVVEDGEVQEWAPSDAGG